MFKTSNFLSILIVLFSIQNGLAQKLTSKEIDSAFIALKVLPNTTQKVEDLLSLYKNSIKSRFINEAILDEAKSISEDISYFDGLAKCFNRKGITARVAFDYSNSVLYHKRALNYLNNSTDSLLIAKCLLNLGVTYRKLNLEKEAFEYYFKALKFSEKIAVRYSDVVVADNKSIADYVIEEYGIEAEVIAYGGDHAVIADLKLSDEGYALALCRIEPENNVEMILESFSKTNKKLMFIGNWNNSDFGREMKAKYQDYENIDIVAPVYELDKLFELRQQCSFYVHGHSAGGTNPSLVEMMHFKKNIIAFDCNYNRASTENKAEFFLNTEKLAELVETSEVINNGSTMQEIAERRYTWAIVKEQYFSLFN